MELQSMLFLILTVKQKKKEYRADSLENLPGTAGLQPVFFNAFLIHRIFFSAFSGR